jgi:hypothetical protein
MAKATDLQSLGMGGSALASLVGISAAPVTAAGTSDGTSTPIPPNVTWANVTTASSQTGVKLPAGTSTNPVSQYVPYYVSCTGGQTAVVYPPSGATIDATTSANVTNNTTAVFWKTAPTVWVRTT